MSAPQKPSDDADKLNAFARERFGAEVDAAAGAAGLTVKSAETEEEKRDVRPWVQLPGDGHRIIADFAREMGQAMADAPIYLRETELVTINASGEIELMTAERFMSWQASYVVIYEEYEVGRGEKKMSKKLRKDMPLTTAKLVLAAGQFREFVRPLLRVHIVQMPWKRKDGRIELLPEGYDAESQILTLESEVKIDPKMPIDKAKLVFEDYFGELPFADPRSKAVAITEALALFGMGLQKVEAARMGFMNRSNTQGGGKSLIAFAAITPSYGLPKNTAKAKDDELRKQIDTSVLSGAPYLLFDNLKGHFENSLIEGLMTSPSHQARVMGTQRFASCKVCFVLIITGNNLTVSKDFQRRLLQCDLFVEEFDLNERTHRRDLNPVELNRPEVRAEFLSALWALVRHWDEVGDGQGGRPPAGTRAKPFRIASFAEWSDIFGGIVQCAGYGNPLEKPADDQIAAPAEMHQRKLVELMCYDANAKPDLDETRLMKEFTFQEVVDCCVDNELFTWMIKGSVQEEGDKEWFKVTSECASKFGLMLTNEMAGKSQKQRRYYTLPDGRRVCFDKKGAGRDGRYIVTFVGRVKTG